VTTHVCKLEKQLLLVLDTEKIIQIAENEKDAEQPAMPVPAA
jgi:hypothetical protein